MAKWPFFTSAAAILPPYQIIYVLLCGRFFSTQAKELTLSINGSLRKNMHRALFSPPL
ncbi:MAG: hypothetical protein ACI8RT_000167 [Candidatus Azotimanducaceae bacterium]|jgi:hypothetical protein|tara:strand:+ start:813 stop:986 length:174 start_codon:yes stop_codon:yes gene_type:complete